VIGRPFIGLVVLSLAAGGCASISRPAWWPFPRTTSESTEVARPEPARRPPTAVPPPLPPPPEPDRLAPLYRVAKAHIAGRRDDQAYRALIQIVRVNPQYRDCPKLLRDVRSRLVRTYYQEGMRLFREEKLELAIVEWRAVLEVDPAHANARRNIDQAEQILRTLAEHQRR
jgi:hypothetical protein